MGPSMSIDGVAVSLHSDGAPGGGASMGPSMSIDGVAAGREMLARSAGGFNGAVDEHRRSHVMKVTVSGHYKRTTPRELQWGRR